MLSAKTSVNATSRRGREPGRSDWQSAFLELSASNTQCFGFWWQSCFQIGLQNETAASEMPNSRLWSCGLYASRRSVPMLCTTSNKRADAIPSALKNRKSIPARIEARRKKHMGNVSIQAKRMFRSVLFCKSARGDWRLRCAQTTRAAVLHVAIGARSGIL
jgi:hypothetical protein